MGQMVDLILKQSATPIHFDRVYETDMSEGLKAMALEGHGIAFLPHSAVKKELRAKRLVSAAPPELKGLEVTMEVRAYREAPMRKDVPRMGQLGAKSVAVPQKRTAQALWDYLLTQTASHQV